MLHALALAFILLQTPLAFEVVSVKPSDPAARGGGFGTSPGQFVTRNMAVNGLIVMAYGVAGYQVVGGPAWPERFDIIAKMPEGTYTEAQQSEMLRSLLADRFKLKVHRETRELPIYALAVAKKDSKPGPELRPPGRDCAAIRAKRATAGNPPPRTAAEMLECRSLSSNGPGGRVSFQAQSMTMSDFATAMRRYTTRPIFDRTELSGEFDIELKFLPETSGAGPADPQADTDVPSIFTAMQDQLGLKLEGARAPISVLVIDAIERPTEN